MTEKKVVGSDGFDGLNDEGDSDYFGYKAGGGLRPSCTLLHTNPLHNKPAAALKV